MGWRKYYLDATLVPLGFTINMAYHAWLWHKVRVQPLSTIIGTNASGRRNWVSAIMKEKKKKETFCSICRFDRSFCSSENDKKNILGVQSFRNLIMGSTLMATTSMLLSTGLAAILSSSYSVKQPLKDTIFGARGEFMVEFKYVTLLTIFLFSFFCHSLSIRFVNEVGILINSPQDSVSIVITPGYVSELLEKGFLLNTVGNRLFYTAMPLLLWIFGPVPVFLCYGIMVPVFYNLDFLVRDGKVKVDANDDIEIEVVVT